MDDHEEVTKSLSRLARSWGHKVAVANDAVTALSVAQDFQPQCAIVDLSLPGMSGMDLARRLRHVFPPAQLYLIALTGLASDEVRAECFAAGFDTAMVKPGDLPLLEKLLGVNREHPPLRSARRRSSGNISRWP